MKQWGIVRKGTIIKETVAVSVLHLAVDMTTAGFLFSYAVQFGVKGFAMAIILYNILAFGLQPVFGMLCDKMNATRPMLFVSLAVIGIFGLAHIWVWVNLVVLSIANAAFHVSAASTVMANQPHKASCLGVYVSTGAIGLAVGVGFAAIPVMAGGAICLFSVLLYPQFKTNLAITQFSNRQERQTSVSYKKWMLPLLLVLLAVLLRGFLGGAIKPGWQVLPVHAVAVAFSVAFGKAIGGFLADSLGAPLTAIITLIPAALFLTFLKDTVPGAVIGLVLFNTAMPVTLLLATELLPKNRACAFGLTACILMIGSLSLALLSKISFSNIAILVLTLAGAACIALGARLSKQCNVKIKTDFKILIKRTLRENYRR